MKHDGAGGAYDGRFAADDARFARDEVPLRGAEFIGTEGAVIGAKGAVIAAAPGRSCPPHYGYSPRVFARAAEIETDALYVIGGLYGNPLALDAIEAMAAAEPIAPRLVFNGDFHWFDASETDFAAIQRRVLAHTALRGNVETEIASDDAAAGCGCAYPESVPDDDVERSNSILSRLREVATRVPMARERLGVLPMHAVAQVGALRVGLVHGDAWSLAGWRFAHDSLHGAAQDDALRLKLGAAFALGAVDGYACSHTCAPALALFGESGADRFIINNGAAGMANFAGATFGVITRIGCRALPQALQAQRLYGMHERGVWIDAIKVEFDADAWLAHFDALWPAGSAAALSYRQRIAQGPAFSIDNALGRAAARC